MMTAAVFGRLGIMTKMKICLSAHRKEQADGVVENRARVADPRRTNN